MKKGRNEGENLLNKDIVVKIDIMPKINFFYFLLYKIKINFAIFYTIYFAICRCKTKVFLASQGKGGDE